MNDKNIMDIVYAVLNKVAEPTNEQKFVDLMGYDVTEFKPTDLPLSDAKYFMIID